MHTTYALHIEDAATGLQQEMECLTIEDAFCHLEHLVRSEIENPDRHRPLDVRIHMAATKRPVWQPMPPEATRQRPVWQPMPPEANRPVMAFSEVRITPTG